MAIILPTCIVYRCHKSQSAKQKGRCEEHDFKGYESNRKERLEQPGVNWKALSKSILTASKGVCALCGSDGTDGRSDGPADTVDHIIPGDNHHPSNLQAVHDRTAPHCHRYKTAKEGQAALRETIRLRNEADYYRNKFQQDLQRYYNNK